MKKDEKNKMKTGKKIITTIRTVSKKNNNEYSEDSSRCNSKERKNEKKKSQFIEC